MMELKSPLLDLPSELRIRIYEFILGFARPLKLRQTVAGSQNTTLLRVNRQIYGESLPVLYDINDIAVTRNDFCKRTDVSLKTPVQSQHIRHLLIRGFGESLACNFGLDRCDQCDVCEPSASGLLNALKSMPRLKSVVVDYHTHTSNFKRFSDTLSLSDMQRVGKMDSLRCTAVGHFTLHNEAFRNVDFTFQNIPLARIWQALISLWSSLQSGSRRDDEEVLIELRKIDADMPDKLWLVVCVRRYITLEEWVAAIAPLQDSDLSPAYAAWRAHKGVTETTVLPLAFGTQQLQYYLRSITAPQSRRLLTVMKDNNNLRLGRS